MTASPPAASTGAEETTALRHRLTELQQRVAELETELAEARRGVDPRERLRLLLPLAATLLLAAIPAALVFLDRWLGNRRATDLFLGWWCRIGLLCQSAYPPYFLLIFPCLLGCVTLVWLLSGRLPAGWLTHPLEWPASDLRPQIGKWQSRLSWCLLLGAGASFALIAARAIVRHALPGWDLVLAYLAYLLGWFLREMPLSRWREAWQRHGHHLVAVLLAASALLLMLSSYYGQRRFQWAFAVLLALALVNLIRCRRTVSPITWIALLALALFASNMNAWWLSVIGDEYSFWAYGREIAEKQSLAVIGSNLFSGQAVYGAHPYFSSLIQALFMKLFSSNGFGWRVSNACICAAAVVLFYCFFKTFVARRAALMAALFLAMSHYLISFGKIGYNNLQAFFAESLALAAAAWSVRTRRPVAFVALGAAMALCFYVYPAALYVLPPLILLLLFYTPPTSRAALGRWTLLAVSLLALVFPLLLQPGYWQAKIAGTIFYTPELTRTVGSAARHFAVNFVYAALSFLYVAEEDHFIAVGYVDPLSATLAVLGFAALLRLALRERFAAWFAASFVILLTLAGASHDRPFPSGTRMFLLLPWFALFAAAGLTWVIAQLRSGGLLRGQGTGLAVLVFIAVLGINLYQAYPLARDRMTGFQSLETLFNRLLQRAQREEDMAPKTYVFITDPTWTSAGYRDIPDVYPVRARFAEVVVTAPELPESAAPLIADRNALVIIKPWLDPAWQGALDSPLRALGKVPCPISATNGDWRFTLWHSPGLERLCQ